MYNVRSGDPSLHRSLEELRSQAHEAFSERSAVGRWTTAFSRWLVDASLLSDAENLRDALAFLTRREAGLAEEQISALAAVASAALDRARQAQLEETLDPSSLAARLLQLIHEAPDITTAEAAGRLDTAIAEVSRSCSNLSQRGLTVMHKSNREWVFRLTSRGESVVQSLLRRKENDN